MSPSGLLSLVLVGAQSSKRYNWQDLLPNLCGRTGSLLLECNTVVRPSDDLSLVFTSVQEVKSDQYRVSYYETAELNGSDSSGSRGQ